MRYRGSMLRLLQRQEASSNDSVYFHLLCLAPPRQSASLLSPNLRANPICRCLKQIVPRRVSRPPSYWAKRVLRGTPRRELSATRLRKMRTAHLALKLDFAMLQSMQSGYRTRPPMRRRRLGVYARPLEVCGGKAAGAVYCTRPHLENTRFQEEAAPRARHCGREAGKVQVGQSTQMRVQAGQCQPRP